MAENQVETNNFKDLVPRKCFATNKVLGAKDRASVQINFLSTGLNKSEKSKPLSVTLSGFVRSKGQSDAAVNRYLKQEGLISF
jgi:small subunit ribosomal protein S21e